MNRKFILWDTSPIAVAAQSIRFCGILAAFFIHPADPVKHLGQIQRIHADTVPFQGQLVKTYSLEFSGPGADSADGEPPHLIDNPADSGKL